MTRTVPEVVADLEQVGKDIADLLAQTKVIHDAMVAKQTVQTNLETEYSDAKAAFESQFLATHNFIDKFVETVKSIF